ncbi:hypothetical protein F503_08365 [Ophiostoma piceae UAMH 11346]|uniref:Uncharacterized protein n=1 Tax=Ophiostoma piceae (strain UAMH 11346) TaxID=1262450 RepID=S3BX57_OPHP1|nr:hypothetical protein F503_08365 [Ophiostoma piceae UAMH 11346]
MLMSPVRFSRRVVSTRRSRSGSVVATSFSSAANFFSRCLHALVVALRRQGQQSLVLCNLQVELGLLLGDNVVERGTLDIETRNGRVRIVPDALELLVEKVEAARHAAVHLVDGHLNGRVGVLLKQLAVAQQALAGIAEPLHGTADLVQCVDKGLRPLPQDLAVTLHQLKVHLIEVKVRVALLVVDLVAVCNGMLELAQPLAGSALLVVHGAVQLVAYDDGRQQDWVRRVGRARAEMLVDNLVKLARLGALGVARSYGSAEVVAQHELPATCEALFAHVRLAEHDVQVRVGVVLVESAPEKGSDNAGALNGAERQVELADHVDVVGVREGNVLRRERLGMFCS